MTRGVLFRHITVILNWLVFIDHFRAPTREKAACTDTKKLQYYFGNNLEVATYYCGQKLAKSQGYNDIFYFDSKDGQRLEEVAAANMFLILPDAIKTPVLKGTILPGVTRNSIVQLAKDIITDRPMIEGDITIEDF